LRKEESLEQIIIAYYEVEINEDYIIEALKGGSFDVL
jgi:hypothetical protein